MTAGALRVWIAVGIPWVLWPLAAWYRRRHFPYATVRRRLQRVGQ